MDRAGSGAQARPRSPQLADHHAYRILPILLPGVQVLSRRARLFSLYPFLLDEYRRSEGSPNNEALSDFILWSEFDFAVAVQLCPNGCAAASAGAAGALKAGPAAREARARQEPVTRQRSVKSNLGGYGLYYRTPLTDLGLVVPRGTAAGGGQTPVDVVSPFGLGTKLAASYREAVEQTVYYRDYLHGGQPTVPVHVLEELAEVGCLCRLRDYADEQALLRDAFFVAPVPELRAACDQRRRSFALLLRELELDPRCADDDRAYCAALWKDFEELLVAAEAPPPANLAEVLAQWAALVAKEYLQEAIYTLWRDFCARGVARQPLDGYSAEELDALICGCIESARTRRLPSPCPVNRR